MKDQIDQQEVELSSSPSLPISVKPEVNGNEHEPAEECEFQRAADRVFKQYEELLRRLA